MRGANHTMHNVFQFDHARTALTHARTLMVTQIRSELKSTVGCSSLSSHSVTGVVRHCRTVPAFVSSNAFFAKLELGPPDELG